MTHQTMPQIPNHWIRPGEARRRSGRRAGQLADLQLVCGAGPYELDVLIRELEEPRGVDFVGQVTRAESIHEPVTDLQLTLVAAVGEREVSQTSTNDFGEFSFGRRPNTAYGLRVGGHADAPCVLIWEGAA